MAPGVTMPRSTKLPKAMRGVSRRVGGVATTWAGGAGFGAQPAPGGLHIGRVPLDADEVPVQALGHRGGGAGAEKRVQDDVARRGGWPG